MIKFGLGKPVGKFLISNYRCVLNVICFLVGNSPASEFYMPKFRNTQSFPSSYLPACEDGTVSRNVGIFNSDAGELPRRKQTSVGKWYAKLAKLLPALVWTQPLTEMSTRNIYWGVKADSA